MYPIFLDRYEHVGSLSWNDEFIGHSVFVKVYNTHIHYLKARHITFRLGGNWDYGDVGETWEIVNNRITKIRDFLIQTREDFKKNALHPRTRFEISLKNIKINKQMLN